MIILDTNVLSELVRPEPSKSVVTWLNSQPQSQLASTAMSLLEMRTGATVLPHGRRRDELLALVDGLFDQLFDELLVFDSAAAVAFSEIVAQRRRSGRPIGTIDAMIASVARVRGATVATRDTNDFSDCGVPLINPWNA